MAEVVAALRVLVAEPEAERVRGEGRRGSERSSVSERESIPRTEAPESGGSNSGGGGCFGCGGIAATYGARSTMPASEGGSGGVTGRPHTVIPGTHGCGGSASSRGRRSRRPCHIFKILNPLRRLDRRLSRSLCRGKQVRLLIHCNLLGFVLR